MSDRVISLPDANATQNLGRELGAALAAGSILLLTGNLGSGKTTLVQGIAQGLGIDEPIVSPTFTIINEYFSGRLPLYHLDLYRLEPPEVEDLHLESYWSGLDNELGIVAIEWAERMRPLPADCLRIELTYDLTNGRSAKISSGD